MSYLTDTEEQLLFSALSMEKKICEEVDKEYCREPYETPLKRIVEDLKRKFYYDRFKKEIRAKAIEEFAEEIKSTLPIAVHRDCSEVDYEVNYALYGLRRRIDRIAEQMKGEAI